MNKIVVLSGSPRMTEWSSSEALKIKATLRRNLYKEAFDMGRTAV